MKNLIAITAAAALSMGVATPAMADAHMERADTKAQSPVVVEKNKRGKATKVRIGGEIYDVCMTERQDNCIQPRAAGLNWGDLPQMEWSDRDTRSG